MPFFFSAMIHAKGYVDIFCVSLPYPLALLYLLLPWPNWGPIWKYAKRQQNGMGRSHMLEMCHILSPRMLCWLLVFIRCTLILHSLCSVLGCTSHSQDRFVWSLMPFRSQSECWWLTCVSFHFRSQAQLIQRTDFPGDFKSSMEMNIMKPLFQVFVFPSIWNLEIPWNGAVLLASICPAMDSEKKSFCGLRIFPN